MNLWSAYLGWLYPDLPAEFVSQYSLEESIWRLREASVQAFPNAFFQEPANGGAWSKDVTLGQAATGTSGPLTMEFVGTFRQCAGRTVLSGRFVVSRWAKAAQAFTIGFLGMLFLGSIKVMLASPRGNWPFPLAALGFLMVNVALSKTYFLLARRSAAWLTGQVIQAFASKDEMPPETLPG